MNKTVKLALEALNTGDVPKRYFDQSKQRLASSPQDIEDILPSSGNEDRFIENLSSEGYRLVVKKLANYLNLSIADLMTRYTSIYSFIAVVMQTMEQIKQIESAHKQELEKLALQVVFDLPEFAQFKKLYEQGILKLDIKLGPADLQNAKTMDDIEEDIEEQQENIIENVGMNIEADPDGKLKRVFHNYITQGNAVHKSFLFNLVKEELDNIDETLTVKYGLFMSIVHVLYYGTPYAAGGMLKDAGIGSSENLENDTIKIRGVVFPVLVHEIVKGLFEYLGKDISQEAEASETLEGEYMPLMAGPELFSKLNAMIPRNKIEFLPIIYRFLLKRSPEEIKQVIANSPQGKQVINSIIVQAEAAASEEGEDYNEGGYEDDGGYEDEGGGEEDNDPYNLYGGN